MTVPPPVVPDYELLRRIGRGSYGDVWLGRSVTGQLRAVKVVYRDRFESERPFDREFDGIQKFEKISRQYPSQLDVFHVGRNGVAGFFYYVMELADDASQPATEVGAVIDPATYEPLTLKTVLQRRGHLPVEEVLETATTLAEALHQLHETGLIHRDIKPSNIIFVRGQPKFADIGLITSTDAALSFVGTEGFVPREGPGTVGADLFALGKVIYEAATGRDRMDFPRLPEQFENRADRALLLELNEAWLKACDPEPKHRYATAADLRNDLVLLKARKSIRRLRTLERQVRRSRRLIVASIAIGLLVAYGWAQSHRFNRYAAAQLSHVYVQHGQERLEQGDTIGALPWFAAAMHLEDFDQNREAEHRRRLANTLDESPDLVQLVAYLNDPMPRYVYFDRTGRRALICEPGDTAQVMDIATGTPVTPKLKHTTQVRRSWFNDDASRVVTLSTDGWLRHWDAKTGELKGEPIPPATGSAGARFSPDGQTLFTAGMEGRLAAWDSEGRLLREQSFEIPITSLALAGNGKSLAIASHDPCKALVVDSTSLLPRCPEIGLPAAPSAMTLSETAGFLAIGFEGGEIEFWDLSGNPTTPAWRGKMAGPLFKLEFDRAEERLLAGSEHNIGIFDVGSGSLHFPLLEDISAYRVLEWSPDQTRVLVAGESRTARLYDASSGSPLTPPLRQAGEIAVGRFTSDGEWLTASADRTMRHWTDPAAERSARRFDHDAELSGAWLIPGRDQLLTLDQKGVPRLWSWTTSQVNQSSGQPLGAVKRACFGEDGRTFAALTDDRVELREIDRLDSMANWDLGPDGGYNLLAIHTGRSLAFVGGDRGQLRLWDWRSGQEFQLSTDISGTPQQAGFSPDGETLAVGVTGGHLLIWRLNVVERPPLKLELSDRPALVAFTENSDRLLVATEDRTFQWWDPRSGEPLSKRLRAEAGVNFARISSDATRVFTAGVNFEAMTWDTLRGEPLTRPFRPRGQIVDAAFSPDAEKVALLDREGAVQLWNVASGEPLGPIIGGQAPATSCSFSRNGRRLLIVENHRTAVVRTLRETVPSARELADRAALISSIRLDHNGLPQPVSVRELLEIDRRQRRP